MIYVLIVCLIIIGFLGYKLYQKQKIDKEELQLYNQQLKQVKQDVTNAWTDFHLASQNLETANNTLKRAKEETEYEKYKLEECKKDLQAAMDVYQDLTDNKLKEIDASIEEQRNKRQESLDAEIRSQTELTNKIKEELEKSVKEAQEWCDNEIAQAVNDAKIKCDEYHLQIESEQEKLSSIQKVLKQYTAEQQEKLFYTIQLPEEYKEDIEFLLTTVAARLFHKDIIYKLIWNEYIKLPFDNLVKRIELKSEPGIYKITSIKDGKCYIGKSTDVKKRLTEHIKGALGLSTISDQEVHHAIKEQGFNNWTIEIITYCEKDRLGELEKYYINFFKSQEWGYNRTGGG